MNYCISDVHEQKLQFMQLLERIQFGDDDHMYILGDVLARGDGSGIELLQLIMSRPKHFTLITGNHETAFTQAILDGASVEDNHWKMMHSEKTAAVFFALPKSDQADILCFLRSLPSCMDISVAGKDYHLVHGWPGNTIRERVWGRPNSLFVPNPFKEKTLIIGHTPVVLIHCKNDMEQNTFFHHLEATGDHMRILDAPGGWIDLDCGCSYPVPGAALGCLRLEDGVEFYVRSDGKVTV